MLTRWNLKIRIPRRSKHRKADAQPGGTARSRMRRLFTWRKLLAAFLALLLVPTGAFAVLYLSIEVPEANEQARAESNVYLYSDGTVAARTGEVNRESVDIDRVPKAVQHAFVAAENKSFYEDAGLDPVGLARGLINTGMGKGTQGGSTITQQYVKNYYLSQEQTLTRKAREMVIALKVDQEKTKDDILAGYLNSSYFGRVAYGIQAAARAYYDRPVEELTVAQGAYLAALVQAPSQYDWAVASPAGKKHVKERWTYVLDNMVGQGWLDEKERRGMRFPEPVAPQPGAGLDGQAGYFVDAARQELLDSGVSDQELAAGGWTITLSIDREKQKSLETAVAQHVDDTKKGGKEKGGKKPRDEKVRDQMTRERRSGDGKPGDERRAGRNAQVGAVSVEPESGRVVALYGGRDYTKHYLNNATRSDFQAGPAFKPISVAARLNNKVRQAKADDGSRAAEPPPRTYAAEVKDTAVDLGMSPDATGYDSRNAAELGLVGASPMELAGVYATFGRHGSKVTPSVVKSATRGDERPDLRDAVGGQALERDAADSITAGLNRAPDPTGRAVAVPSRFGVPGGPVESASGPSDDNKAAWSVGYSTELATVVGLFGEDHKTRKQTNLTDPKGGVPDRIWYDYTQETLSEQ